MYICIEGNIGAGKTTLAVALAKRRRAHFLAEEFRDNPLLPLFYKNRKKMAFPLEYSFLISRHAQLYNYFNGKHRKITVADFSLHKCLWFAKSNLTKEEFKFYKEHYKVIESVSPKPDLLIYIHTHHKNLLMNIEKRGRSYEKNIGKKYLQSVTENYASGLQKMKNIPVIEFCVGNYKPETVREMVNHTDDILKKGIKFKYKTIVL